MCACVFQNKFGQLVRQLTSSENDEGVYDMVCVCARVCMVQIKLGQLVRQIHKLGRRW